MSGRIGVFLDRDGTLNVERDFIARPEEIQLIPGAADAVQRLNREGLVACVISNQSGVARGYLTEEDLVPIHARLSEDLGAGGARVDRYYYCPHHPTEGMPPYNVECECRKPKPGMLLQGAREFGLDLTRSYVIGDRMSDVQAGQAVGAATVLVLTGYGETAREECRAGGVVPDLVAPSITEAVQFVMTSLKGDHRGHA